jgi:hypothetical protein
VLQYDIDKCQKNKITHANIGVSDFFLIKHYIDVTHSTSLIIISSVSQQKNNLRIDVTINPREIKTNKKITIYFCAPGWNLIVCLISKLSRTCLVRQKIGILSCHWFRLVCVIRILSRVNVNSVKNVFLFTNFYNFIFAVVHFQFLELIFPCHLEKQ